MLAVFEDHVLVTEDRIFGVDETVAAVLDALEAARVDRAVVDVFAGGNAALSWPW